MGRHEEKELAAIRRGLDKAGSSSRGQSSCTPKRSVVAAITFAVALIASWAFAANYTYDANGRLIAIKSDDGEIARYFYDVNGNITEVDRVGAGELAITALRPMRGAPGVRVVIEGHGFSPTIPENSVLFDGMAASVESASPSELSVIVPPGATTGYVTVSVGAQTTLSPQMFVVDENAGPPVITSIEPVIAAVGTIVTVQGQRLAPTAVPSWVRVNNRPVRPSILTNTSASFPVPPRVGSGRVMVTTPYGTGLSAQDLLVVPERHATHEIALVSRISVGAPVTPLSVANSNQHVAVLFEGISGELLSVQLSSMSAANIKVSLYGVDNSLLSEQTHFNDSLTAHLPALPATGTYLLMLKPSHGPASWGMAIERADQLVVGQPPTGLSVLVPGQSKRYMFFVDLPGGLGIGGSNLAANSGASVSLRVDAPNGTSLSGVRCYLYYPQCDLNVSTGTTGIHALIVAPQAATGATSLDVSLTRDHLAELNQAESYSFSLGRVGQNARLRFLAEMGDRLEINIEGQATVPAGREVYYRVYKPDGSLFASRSATGAASLSLDSLPMGGQYEVFVDPFNGALVDLTVELDEPSSWVLQVDGESTRAETSLAGQVAELTFEGTAGTELGLGLTNTTVSGTSDRYIHYYVYSPSGQNIAATGGCWVVTGCDLNFSVTETGKHKIHAHSFNNVMGFTATLSTDVSLSSPVGVKNNVHIDRFGQNGRMDFRGSLGETLLVQIASASFTDTHYRVYSPEGLLMASVRTGTVATLELSDLPRSGDYQLFIDPVNGGKVSVYLTVGIEMVADVIPDGPGYTYTGTPSEPGAHFSFFAEAGANIGLGISELLMSDMESGFAQVTVIGPVGNYVSGVYCEASAEGCDVELRDLDEGIHNIFVTHGNDHVLSFSATLSTEWIDTLVPNVSQPVTLQRPGKDALLYFDAVAGRSTAVRMSSLSIARAPGRIDYVVADPSGEEILSASLNDGRTIYLLAPSLSLTGRYSIRFDPAFGATADFQLVLLEDLSLQAGEARSFLSAGRGDRGVFELAVSAGDKMTLDISAIVTEGTTNAARVRLYRPDESYVAKQCSTSSTECSFNLSSFEPGSYRLEVEPPTPGAGTVAFVAALSAQIEEPLVANVPQRAEVAEIGQTARYAFEGTAGSSMTLVLSDVHTLPIGRALRYTVHRPDGSIYRGPFSANGTTTIYMPTPPVSGAYVLDVDLPSGTTAQFLVEVNTGSNLAVGASPAAFSSAYAWERSYFWFTMSSTGSRKLRTNQLITVGTTNSVRVEVHRPNGSSTYQNCEPGTATCTMTLSGLSPGTYGVVVHPPLGGEGTMSFGQTLATQ